MSGHSKWATIKRKKAKIDAVRGKLFTKLLREISTAAKQGAGNPDANPRLRMAIEKAKQGSVPADTIQRAIDKATGAGESVQLEEITYEGYGPAGVAILVEVITDNRNRTASEIKHIFSRGGGNVGELGCVGWMFKKKGMISFDKGKVDEDKLTMEAIESGAEDIDSSGSTIDITTSPETLEKVRDILKSKGFVPDSADITMTPSTTVTLQGEDAQKVINLVTALEDNDDVQAVHSNFDIPDDLLMI